MPNIDPPAQTQVKGTMKSAIQLRVVAPAVKPSATGVYQAPEGGECRSMDEDGIAPMISERRKVLPQERQSATSVDTLMSPAAIFARQEGQMTSMDSGKLCHRSRFPE